MRLDKVIISHSQYSRKVLSLPKIKSDQVPFTIYTERFVFHQQLWIFHWYSTWINRSRTKRRHNNQRTLDQQHDIKNDFRSVIETSEMEWNRTCLHRSQVNGRKSMSLHSSTLQCFPRSGNSGVPIRSYQNPKTLEENRRRRRRRIGEAEMRWDVMERIEIWILGIPVSACRKRGIETSKESLRIPWNAVF